MLKNFKLITSLILVIASSFGAVAQTETYKDVILDGKPAKLNVKTGEVVLVGTIKTTTSETNKGKSEIEANLISRTSKSDKIDKTKASITNNEAKTALSKDTISMTSENQKSTLPVNRLDHEVAILKEKATAMVYDVSPSVTYENNTTDFHKVIKGETLYSLSKRYNTTLGDLKKANNLETTLIMIGQNLRVRNFESSGFVQTPSVWTVSKGDTLYNIAHRNNTTVASIKLLNGLTSNLIKIGQQLQLK